MEGADGPLRHKAADPPPPGYEAEPRIPSSGSQSLTKQALSPHQKRARAATARCPGEVPLRRVMLSDEGVIAPASRGPAVHHGQALSFSASSVWGVSTRFRLEIGMITRREQSFGTPQGRRGRASANQGESGQRNAIDNAEIRNAEIRTVRQWFAQRLQRGGTVLSAPRVACLRRTPFSMQSRLRCFSS